jgi:hypothetical protein
MSDGRNAPRTGDDEMQINVKSPEWTLIERADQMREMARELRPFSNTGEIRAVYLACAARLYRAAGQEGSALLCEETM